MATDMRILLLGSHGMLGNEFMDILESAPDIDVIGMDINDIDVRRRSEVLDALHTHQPDVVINATGYTDVDGAETDEEEAYALNAYAPKYIAEGARDENALVVHFSTDFVFNGQDPDGYTEDQIPEDPVNTYGRSKRRGEEYVIETDPFYYLIRTSWVFGKHGKNFIQKIRQKALSGEEDTIRVVNDQHGNPTYTRDLVHAVLDMIREETEHGVYHLTNSTPTEAGITKYDLAQTTVTMLGSPVYVAPVDSSAFPTPAPRPQYSLLRNTKRPPLQNYEEAVHEYTLEEQW